MPATLKRLATEDGSVSPPSTKRRIHATTTSKAVASFFTPASKKEPSKTHWRTVDTSLLVCKYDKPHTSQDIRPRKIAAFDFDSTLITTASGKVYSSDVQDWRFWHATVEGTLHKLVDDGYLVVILSNQAGLSLESSTSKTPRQDGKRVTDFKGKVDAVMNHLDLPITLYAATAKDLFRKPRTGMWDQMLKDHDLTTTDAVDIEGSVFVGDAGGRTVSGHRKRDFSCSDRDMAANAGIPFRTPEEYFLKEEARPFARTFDPGAYLNNAQAKSGITPVVFSKKNAVDIVLFVGSPGAGKSTFFWEHLRPLGYERVNQDILKTRDRCIKVAKEHVEKGRCVAVDNTNADIDVRSHWVELAKTYKIPIRCVMFTASSKLCEHNDTVRALGGVETNPEARTMLPKLAFTGFSSRYREPALREGFQDITKVDFQFKGTDEQRTIWSRYWTSG